ncbi:hypothetical protein PCIT_a3704 [Pseudoalteromonas citrea]|uniref:Uncharacterized protein n=1 Tax=Pseudoalteromonas citrea TaxID=43655 RepID=A0AAD4AGD2_9GAMM|nr:hypothetical protein PCIT_a3704 [Pseudoalteromonas citrea]
MDAHYTDEQIENKGKRYAKAKFIALISSGSVFFHQNTDYLC